MNKLVLSDKNHIMILGKNTGEYSTLCKMLKNKGYKTECTDCVEDFFHTAARLILDLIIINVDLPGIDGYEFCKQIKADRKLRSVPVILIGKSISNEDELRGIRAGAVDVIDKTHHNDIIDARISAHLNVRHRQMQLRQMNYDLLCEFKESEELFRNTFEQAAVGISHTSVEGHFLRVNHRFLEITGYEEDEITGQLFSNYIYHDDKNDEKNNVENLLDGKVKSYMNEFRIICKSGAVIWGRMTVSLVRTFSGEPDYLVGVLEDITHYIQAEEELLKVNRALKTISRCNEVLVRSKDEPELLDSVCRIIVDVGNYKLAWVGFPEQGEDKGVRIAAHVGFNEGCMESMKIAWADSSHNSEPAGAAIRTGNYSLVEDTGNDPRFGTWSGLAKQRGFSSVLALPLKYQQDVIGVLVLCAEEVAAFSREEVSLLNSLANNLAYGINTLRERKKNEQIEANRKVMAQRLELATKTARIGVWDWDIKNNHLIWDEQMYILYGIDQGAQPVSYDVWLKMLHPEDRKFVSKEISLALYDEIEFNTDFRIVLPDCSVRIIQAAATVFCNSKKEPERMIGVNWDITDLKAAHDRVRELNEELEGRVKQRTAELEAALVKLGDSEEKFRSMTSAANSAIIMIDSEGRIIVWNEAACKIFGWTLDEVMGIYINDILIYDEYSDIFERVFPEFQKTGINQVTGKTIEFTARRKNGDLFPAEVSLSSVQIKGKWNVIGIVNDITIRKRNEEEIKKLSRVVEQSPSTVMITDVNGFIQYVNPKFVELTGYSEEEVLGRTPRVLKSSRHNKKYYKKLWETILSGNEWHNEICNRKKNGEVYWELASISPVRNDKNEITHFVAVTEDITERRHVAEELKRAKEAAEAATRAKSDFLANMSHEIRTPMNAIIGIIYLLKKTPLTPGQQDYLNKMQFSSKNLLGLINQILDFSKIEAGKLSVELIEFDLNEVIENVVNSIAIKAQEKGLDFIIDIDKDVPSRFIGDPLRLGQVILNLANNAVKFTEKGEIVIALKVLFKSEDKYLLEFAVKDTGIGLSQDQRNKLFRSFVQADTTTTRKYGGTGLGLVISKKITEMMGGEIGIVSREGEGSTFSFTLVMQNRGTVTAHYNTLPQHLQGLHTLVLEQNRSARTALEKYLNNLSCTVSVFADDRNIVQAVADAEQAGKKYDMIFITRNNTTPETIKHINENEKIQSKPRIILMTEYGYENIINDTNQKNIHGSFFKPATPVNVYNAIMIAFGLSNLSNFGLQHGDLGIPEGIDHIRGAHILLVEDNVINQQLSRGILQEEGFYVDVAENGEQAIAKIKQLPRESMYDLVLMDLQMPVMDGYQASKNIRKRLKLTDLPIIAMTADAIVGVKDRVMKAGMNGYVSKPIDPNYLFLILVTWIKPGKRKPFVPVERTTDKVPTAPMTELPERLPGLELHEGLKRINNNAKLYRSLLHDFYLQHGDLQTRLDIVIVQHDYDTAARLVHSLKGVAGNIGATHLFYAAKELETVLKSKNIDDIDMALHVMLEALEQVFHSIEILGLHNNGSLQKADASQPVAEMPDDQFSSQIETITRLLQENNPDAESRFQEIRPVFIKRYPDHGKLLTQYIENFEFEDALNLLRSLF